QLVADFVDGLVPVNPGPLPIDELHRVFEAALAAHQFAHGGALGAMRTTIARRIPTRLLADPHVIGDFGGDGAADRAVRANAFADYRPCGQRTGSGSFRFANGSKRHCAKDSEAAGTDSRAPQKGAAIEGVVIGDKACERAAARLTI